MNDMKFYALSIVFQSFQEDALVILNVAVCNGTPLTFEGFSPPAGFGPDIARSAFRHLNQ